MHPHLFETSLPTPAWLAGLSLRSCRPKWRELTPSSTRPDSLPTARKRGQHLGIYQKTRMCLFICLFILHLKSGYCSNWIRGKDLSPKEPWPCSPIQQGWKSQDNEWSLMPSHEEALSVADICLSPCLSSLSVLHTRAKQSGSCPSPESSCRPQSRGGHWGMAFSSLAWGSPRFSFSSAGTHWAPTACQACAKRSRPHCCP